MREYELYLVLDADAEEPQVTSILERATQLIVAGDGETSGELIKTESRGKRRLAYAIRKKTESQDVILTFRTLPQALPEVERVLKLDEMVLRYLIVRLDED
ncbi:MAG: 30S ribosomal protein S6 [Anaerolineae bacterium]|jgi:small subunit ribosomal protein S6